MRSEKLNYYLNINDTLEECSSPSTEFFNSNFGSPNIPVLIKDVANKWPAFELWNLDYLKENHGEQIVVARNVMDSKKSTKKFKVKDYLDIAFRSGQTEKELSPYYLIDCQIHLNIPMESHYNVPEYFSCWYKAIDSNKRRHNLSWLYIGGAHTFSNVHLDIWDTSAWNAVLTGCKLWLFYDENQKDFLYEGKVNPFYPDMEKFPEFQFANPKICLQRPGDIVFTPSGWWHAVYNLEAGISLTENFINQTNIEMVMTNFKNRNRAKAIDSLKAIAKNNSYMIA